MTVKLLALDFDGTLTTGQVYVFEDGSEAVICSRADGVGIAKVKALGIYPVVISAETSPVVKARCEKLHLDFYVGVEDKLKVLIDIASFRGVALADVAYVGNDVGDLDCLKAVGHPYVVADAEREILKHGQILQRGGGYGAVRDVCDRIYRDATARGGDASAVD